jgi:hypothetical protein
VFHPKTIKNHRDFPAFRHQVGPQVGAVRRGLCGAKYGEAKQGGQGATMESDRFNGDFAIFDMLKLGI